MKTNMRKITQDELDEIIRLHNLWLEGKKGKLADLSFTDLRDSNMSGINLSYANLNHTALLGTNLRESNLNFANLYGVKLEKANLEGIKLKNADLTYADLEKTNLENANLRGANLRGANLQNANLRGADLSGVNLEDATLLSTDLENAKFHRTNLSYAKVDDMVSAGNLGIYNRTAFYFFKKDRIIYGSFDGTLEDFEKLVKENHSEDSSYLATIKMFRGFQQ